MVTPNEDGIGESTSVSFALRPAYKRRGRGHQLLVEGRPDARELCSRTARAGRAWSGTVETRPGIRPGRPLPHPNHRHLAGPAGPQEPRNRGRPGARPPRDRADALLPRRRRPLGLDLDWLSARPPGGCPRADHGRRPVGGNRSRAWDARSRRRVVFLGRPQQERGGQGTATYRALVEATTTLGTRTLSVPVRIDTRAPAVRARLGAPSEGRAHRGAPLAERGGDVSGSAMARRSSPAFARSTRQAGYSRVTLPHATRVRAQGRTPLRTSAPA